MQYFLESSALAKYFHPEIGTQLVREILDSRGNRIFTCRLALVELLSVSAVKVRTKELTPAGAQSFRLDLARSVVNGQFLVKHLREEDYEQASHLVIRYGETHRLRTLDALHLASAIQLRTRSGIDYFVTSDKSLAAVARLEQFAVINPDES